MKNNKNFIVLANKIRRTLLFVWQLFCILSVLFGGIAAVIVAMIFSPKSESATLGVLVLMLPAVIFIVLFAEFALRHARRSSSLDLTSPASIDALDLRIQGARRKIYSGLAIGIGFGVLLLVVEWFLR